ncbi:hypothetical protein ACHAW5_006512 [Stephanodiscus triporus]|uniref:EamA domain-containing protein n=1 Tax=Stephanodiscus triporus TaxID=2934178 RepID=A0ABD3NEE2_9STRA
MTRKSQRRPVMAADSLRFELEPSSDGVVRDRDYYDVDVGRAGTAATWPSSRGVDDDEFFEEIANYAPASSDKATSTAATTSPAGATTRTDHDEDVVRGREAKLLMAFLLMVIVGTGNKIFQKLQAIPMYNYPNSMNLIQNFVYVPLCFAYILPVGRYGLMSDAIPPEVTNMSKRPFVVMGLLDCLAGTLFTFAAVYLPGSLLILLPQAAIPISMLLSRKIKGGEVYAAHQYLGSAVVVMGILAVLEPLVTRRHDADFACVAHDVDEYCALCGEETTESGCSSHRTDGGGGGGGGVRDGGEGSWTSLLSLAGSEGDSSSPSTRHGELCRWVPSDSAESSSSGTNSATLLIWSATTILACIPMTLSSIYKEMTLSGVGSRTGGIDPIFLNGWVALFQFLFSIALSVPAGMTSDPPVAPRDLPSNIADGIKCYFGIGTITSGCHPDDGCHDAPLYANVFLVFNVCFNIIIVYILNRFGSANVLFMASTVMVPIGNLVFSLPFIPGSTPLKDSDIAGLGVILLGLVAYRFGDKCEVTRWRWITPRLPWRRGKTNPGISMTEEQFEWDAPVFRDGNDTFASSSLGEPLLLTPLQ